MYVRVRARIGDEDAGDGDEEVTEKAKMAVQKLLRHVAG